MPSPPMSRFARPVCSRRCEAFEDLTFDRAPQPARFSGFCPVAFRALPKWARTRIARAVHAARRRVSAARKRTSTARPALGHNNAPHRDGREASRFGHPSRAPARGRERYRQSNCVSRQSVGQASAYPSAQYSAVTEEPSLPPFFLPSASRACPIEPRGVVYQNPLSQALVRYGLREEVHEFSIVRHHLDVGMWKVGSPQHALRR